MADETNDDHAASAETKNNRGSENTQQTRSAGTDAEADRREWSPPRRGVVLLCLIIILAALAVIAVLAAWHLPPFSEGGSWTDDAYVHGRTTLIEPQVDGYITRVHVQDYAHVTRGQLLIEIDDSSYVAKRDAAAALVALRQARLANNDQAQVSARAALARQIAGLASSQAQYSRAQADLRRARALVGDGSVSVRERDADLAAERQSAAAVGESDASVAEARETVRTTEVQRGELLADVRVAQAELESARIDLSHTRITAAEDGQLSQVQAHVGQFVSAGHQLFSLEPLVRWVVADFKERESNGMAVGNHAHITVDALGGRRFDGVVGRLAPATNADFSPVRPNDATGNFVKVPQRLGVLIALDPGQADAAQLRPGMSVEAFVDRSPTVVGPVDQRP